ncbi:MAG: hypothetical protein AAFW73_05665 [Bacteroidota bacterium]
MPETILKIRTSLLKNRTFTLVLAHFFSQSDIRIRANQQAKCWKTDLAQAAPAASFPHHVDLVKARHEPASPKKGPLRWYEEGPR